ncbi:hypothetical protein F5Y10DRAFT_273635 [Nemania abortiva]|nr:hypothetical protein F5Y10DRAFT_273635 [Nemania abortiva]
MANSNHQQRGFSPLSGNTIYRTLCFYTPPRDGTDPEYIAETGTIPGKRNYRHHEEIVPISDIRGQEGSFKIDQHSFAALPGAFTLTIDFNIAERILEDYLPWVERFLLQFIPDSVKATVFDYTLRKASRVKTSQRQVHKIHIDQSPTGAMGRVRRHLSYEDATSIENGESHFRIINVWKPIFGTVTDHPMTFAEFRSLQAADLVPVRQVYTDYVGETYAVRHREGQIFRYWSYMTPNDILLLQCFDSQEQQRVHPRALKHAQCAHGSFRMEEEGETYTRESIEVRCLIVMKRSTRAENV